jgi:hypothetical protein
MILSSTTKGDTKMITNIYGYELEMDGDDKWITKGEAYASLSVLNERGSLNDLIKLHADTLSDINDWFANGHW